MKLGARQAIEAAVEKDLAPGEKVLEAVGGQTGPNPILMILTIWIMVFGAKYRTVVLTNQGLLIHSSNMMRPYNAKELLRRAPFSTPIGPVSGLWSKVDVAGEQIWIHKRFHKDLEAMNAYLIPPANAPQ